MPLSDKHLVIVYHEACIDGAASAWTLQQKLGMDQRTAITYVAYSHSKIEESEKAILAALRPGTELYFADVAPRNAFLDRLLSPANGQKISALHVLDHHQTAAENLEQYKPPAGAGTTPPSLSLEMDKDHPSAAHMIWRSLMPERKPPPFLEMINKMDIGQGLVSKKDFAAAALIDSKSIASIAEAFNTCNALSQMTRREMAEAGDQLLTEQKNQIKKLNENVTYAQLEILPHSPPVRVPVVKADVHHFGRGITNYLNALGRRSGAGVALAWYPDDNGVTMSIRSTAVDASKVAEHFCQTMDVTGGGHKTSAAVHFPSMQHFAAHIILQSSPKHPQKSHLPKL